MDVSATLNADKMAGWWDTHNRGAGQGHHTVHETAGDEGGVGVATATRLVASDWRHLDGMAFGEESQE